MEKEDVFEEKSLCKWLSSNEIKGDSRIPDRILMTFTHSYLSVIKVAGSNGTLKYCNSSYWSIGQTKSLVIFIVITKSSLGPYSENKSTVRL